MHRRPIVICTPEDRGRHLAAGCIAFSYEEATALALNTAIERLARNGPNLIGNLHERPEFLEPLVEVEQNPGLFHFTGFGFPPIPVHNSSVFRPIEYLANHMRRAILPDLSEQHLPEDAVRHLAQSVELIAAQSLVDSTLTAFADHHDGVPEENKDDLENVLRATDPGAYERLVTSFRDSGRAQNSRFLICAPCVNKTLTEATFKRRIPDRVFRHLHQSKKADYDTKFDPKSLQDKKELELALALSRLQEMETEYLSNILTLMSLAERLPAIRVPQLASSFFGFLRETRRRYEEENFAALNRSITNFGEDLAKAIPSDLLGTLANPKTKAVRLVSDLPLEWTLVDNIPLMFRCSVSRVPITPADFLLSHYMLSMNDIDLDESSARRVLVVNCLSDSDPLYQYPQLLSRMLNRCTYPHQYAEAKDLIAYRKALNESKPFILVHFGHGGYDRSRDMGHVQIGTERTNVWEFQPGVIPPIVLLGACDTAAIAETHNTPANAFLGLGARSVLGTFLPVEADRTIELYLRILTNLWASIQGKDAMETWGEVVWKTLVLNRHFDFLHTFAGEQMRRKRRRVPRGVVSEYINLWQQRVTQGPAQGYQLCPEIVKDALGRLDPAVAADFDVFLRRNVVVPHTMFYTHIGSPDSIRIVRRV
jgi:hypothetical protein